MIRVLPALAVALVLSALGFFLFWPTLQRLLYPIDYQSTVETVADRYLLDRSLIYAVIFEESHFNVRAKSRQGALGLMQILPETGEFIGQSLLIDQPFREETLFEPDENILFGGWYLRYLLDRYDRDLDRSLAAYNAGESNVDRWIKQGETGIPFPETANFVKRVKETKKIYEAIYGNLASRQTEEKPKSGLEKEKLDLEENTFEKLKSAL